MKDLSLLIGRILLSLIFIAYMWDAFSNYPDTLRSLESNKVPFTHIVLPFSLGFSLIGTLAVLLGYRARFGSILLILFLLIMTLFFYTRFVQPGELMNFMKNLSILGGLFYVSVNGAGKYSLDGR